MWCIRIFMYMYMHKYTHTYTYIYIYIYIYIHKYTHTYTYIYIYIYIYININIYLSKWKLPASQLHRSAWAPRPAAAAAARAWALREAPSEPLPSPETRRGGVRHFVGVKLSSSTTTDVQRSSDTNCIHLSIHQYFIYTHDRLGFTRRLCAYTFL